MLSTQFTGLVAVGILIARLREKVAKLEATLVEVEKRVNGVK